MQKVVVVVVGLRVDKTLGKGSLVLSFSPRLCPCWVLGVCDPGKVQLANLKGPVKVESERKILSKPGKDWKLKTITMDSKRYVSWSKGNIWNKLSKETIESEFYQ